MVDSWEIVRAIREGDLEAVGRCLRANPGLLNARFQPQGWTLLHHLAALGAETSQVHGTIAADLLERGADPNCRTVLGWTPLLLIALQGTKESAEIINLLLRYGADVKA